MNVVRWKVFGLSPYIRKESIRMAGDGSFTIISVQHQNDFLNELGRSAELEALTQKMDALRLKIQEEETWVKIISGKLENGTRPICWMLLREN